MEGFESLENRAPIRFGDQDTVQGLCCRLVGQRGLGNPEVEEQGLALSWWSRILGGDSEDEH